MKYWEECVSCALDDAGIKASAEQIALIAGAVESSHENYGMAHGYDCIPNPAETQRKDESERHAREMKQAEERERLLKQNIASRYNSRVHVSLRDGGVHVELAR